MWTLCFTKAKPMKPQNPRTASHTLKEKASRFSRSPVPICVGITEQWTAQQIAARRRPQSLRSLSFGRTWAGTHTLSHDNAHAPNKLLIHATNTSQIQDISYEIEDTLSSYTYPNTEDFINLDKHTDNSPNSFSHANKYTSNGSSL